MQDTHPLNEGVPNALACALSVVMGFVLGGWAWTQVHEKPELVRMPNGHWRNVSKPTP